jgi:8-oxo-dGTP pyrophosphatase MutT (NUDIX family)
MNGSIQPAGARALAESLATRIEAEGAVPCRYTQGGEIQEGHLLAAFWFGMVLPPASAALGLQGDVRHHLVFHLRSPIYDGPLALERAKTIWWPQADEVGGGTLEGLPEQEGDPAPWRLEILPAGTIVAAPFVVAMLHQDPDGRVLALPRTREPERLALPGGKVEPADGDVWKDAFLTWPRGLRRELREELGIDVAIPGTPIWRGPTKGIRGPWRARIVYRILELPVLPEPFASRVAWVEPDEFLDRSVHRGGDQALFQSAGVIFGRVTA